MAEAGGLPIQGLPGQQSEFRVSLGELVNPCFQTELRKGTVDSAQGTVHVQCKTLASTSGIKMC